MLYLFVFSGSVSNPVVVAVTSSSSSDSDDDSSDDDDMPRVNVSNRYKDEVSDEAVAVSLSCKYKFDTA